MNTLISVGQAAYINLDDRVDRKEHIQQMLRDAKWPFYRLSATRLDVSPEESGLQMVPRLHGHKGVASIWLSHERALTEFYQGNLNNEDVSFILLEDDVRFSSSDLLSDPLSLPKGLPENWEIILLSPRYRWKKNVEVPKEDEGKYFVTPFLKNEWVDLQKERKSLIITGAHFVIFKNKKVVKKVIDNMSKKSIYDVDNFYVDSFQSYGIHVDEVTAGGFGSDHNYE